MDIREIVQNTAVSKIMQSLYTKNIYIDVAPRVGKSKILIDVFKVTDMDTSDVLITIPSLIIKKSWYNEFKKWGFDFKGKILHKSQLAKIDLKQFKLIIIDEVHDLSYNNIKYLNEAKKPILGLSGSISDNTKKELFYSLRMQCVYKYSKEQAIADKIISDYKIYLVPIELDNKQLYYYNSIATTEKGYYNILCEKYEKTIEKGYGHLAQMRAASVRARFLYNCKSKIKKTIELAKNHERVLIFTQSKLVADQLAISYHGSSKDTLKDFMKEKTNKLSCCKMLSMGITIPNLKTIIFHQMQGSQEQAIQKCLRAMNFEDHRTAEIYVVYYRNTVDEKWVTNALKTFDYELYKRDS